jgi:SpoVK/Ycf46/Vps4 family AAA+-type ATPase
LEAKEIDDLLADAFEHINQGRYRMALTAAREAYESKPEDVNAMLCLAWANLENGDAVQTLELADSAVQICGDDNPIARIYRGFFLMRMSIYEGAISDLDWAIEKNPEFLSWAYLNKARALAGLGKYFEGIEEIDNAIKFDDGSIKILNEIKNYFQIALGYNQVAFSGVISKHKSHLEEGVEAFRQKEFWFSLWAAKDTLNNPELKEEYKDAHLLELDCLLSMFQVKSAYEKAEKLKAELSGDENFETIYQKILKRYSPSSSETIVEELLPTIEKKTDFEFYENKLYHIYQARTYDVIENKRSGKMTYILQFSEEFVRYVGVEVVFDNPFYGNKDMSINGMAVWFLNNIEVGRHTFDLDINKDWKTVEFVQSWGADTPGFWNEGQGRVDIYLDGFVTCSRWFLIGKSEIVNFEENEVALEQSDQVEIQNTDQPKNIRETSLIQTEEKTLEELLEELNGYIGLNSVKQSMKDFVDYLNFIKEREKLGLKSQETFSIHSAFLGNPGTGKTTIARLLGKIFKAMGILKNGHVIEVDRSGLVGQYIGETAQKTNKVINEAMGGLLFIDEAYSLHKGGGAQDFGQEAIDVLLKRMEDANGEFVVIAAGYPEEMNGFLSSNPGLKSRFTHFFNFEDYTPTELVEIFKITSAKEEYGINEEALEILKKEFTELYRKRDQTFGNARVVRNYFNEAKLHLSKRYLKLSSEERTKEAMTTFSPDDIKAVLGKEKIKEVNFEIDDEALSKSLDKLNNLTGLASVKKEINEIVKLARFYKEQGENLNDKFSSHIVFLGNPGTGKTTVARLFSEIYSALGILPKGHLVEVDRQGLVASYVGQTSEKTKEAIDKAIGGTLFIDEAYTLIKSGDSGSDFGKEAVETLLKRMEDDRGKFIVIAAGYTDEMNNFLESNPGLLSRFTRKIFFEDYSPDELLLITKKLIENKGHTLSEDIIEPLSKHYNILYKSRNKFFGNARLARNTVEAALKNHLLRIADIPAEERSEEIFKNVLLEDFNGIISKEKEEELIKKQGSPEVLDKYLNELSDLAGLNSVKKSTEKLISSLKVAKMRKERGLKVIQKDLHSVFAGNPGTGKTTVAKLLGKIYKEMGAIEKGHLVEVDRSLLVGGYAGQSASKTDDFIEKALGGILYINDANSLYKIMGDSGQEIIDTILKRIDEFKNKFIVILAGPSKEMKELMDSNPILQTRFPNYFSFEDYTPRQMLEIALVITQKNGYQLDEGAWQRLLDIFTELYHKKDKSFGNAKTVKNILYKAISNQEERILSINEPADEDLVTVVFEDVDRIELGEL